MAKECILVCETDLAVPMVCAVGTTIEKGAVLKMTDGMVAVLADGDNDIIAGIAQSEHIANQGTSVSVYRRGIFRGYAGAAGVVVGEALITDVGTGASNEIVKADAGSENILGVSFETKADGNQFVFELNPMTVNIA